MTFSKIYTEGKFMKSVLFVLALGLAAVGVGLFMDLDNDDKVSNKPATAVPVGNPTNTTPSTSSTSSKYKDGTYFAIGTYESPAGPEDIQVNLTLKNGIITDSSVIPKAKDGKSQYYQEAFIGGYKAYVIGKDISTVKLDKISGASLTPAGFNAAVSAIAAQAKA